MLNQLNETPLTVLVQHNHAYNEMLFEAFLELLKGNLESVDMHGQTVLHHIIHKFNDKESLIEMKYYLTAILAFMRDAGHKLAQRRQTRNAQTKIPGLSVLDFVDEMGRTVLYHACKNGDLFSIKMLLDAGAAYMDDDNRLSVFEGVSQHVLLLLLLQKDLDGIVKDEELEQIKELLDWSHTEKDSGLDYDGDLLYISVMRPTSPYYNVDEVEDLVKRDSIDPVLTLNLLTLL